MFLSVINAMIWVTTPLLQDAIVKPPPRLPLPRPAANAPMVDINQNRSAAGALDKGSLTVALDIVEAAWRAEGPGDPVVRVLALAERGKKPQVPGPMLRGEVGTRVKLSLRNRSDSAIMMSGFRQSLEEAHDTLHVAPGATREISFSLDSVGTFFYWGALKGLSSWRDREWLDSQLKGGFIVDPRGSRRKEQVWVVTEWFHSYPDRPFESALVFNGRNGGLQLHAHQGGEDDARGLDVALWATRGAAGDSQPASGKRPIAAGRPTIFNRSSVFG